MKARFVIALLLGTISLQSKFNNQCQATLLKSKTKAKDSDDMEDMVNLALDESFSKTKKKPVQDETAQTEEDFVE